MLDFSVIVDDHKECLKNRARLCGLLHDLFPEEERAINLSLILYDTGIISKMEKMDDLDESSFRRICIGLEEKYGISPRYSADLIVCWAEAYGLKYTSVNDFYNGDENKAGECSEWAGDDSLPFKDVEYLSSDVDGAYILRGKYRTTGQYVVDDYRVIELENAQNGSRSIEIQQYLGFMNDEIEIPSLINGKEVIGIGNEAFRNLNKTKEIRLPKRLIYIGAETFSECQKLKAINFPDSVNSIGERAFRDTGLESVEIPGVEKICDCMFLGCDKLTKVTINSGTVEIESNAFALCKALQYIQFPDTLETIRSEAFSECNELREIVLNEGLKRIEWGAFLPDIMNEIKLKKVFLPRSLEYIGDIAFPDPDEGDFEFYCYKGSFGLEFARKKGYKYRNAEDFLPRS